VAKSSSIGSGCEIAAVRLALEPKTVPGKLPADQIETFSAVVHESQFNKFSHADGLKSIPLLKEEADLMPARLRQISRRNFE
jgi:hypothetical protein